MKVQRGKELRLKESNVRVLRVFLDGKIVLSEGFNSSSRALCRPRLSRPWPRASHKRGPPTTLNLNKIT